ncbi:MAG: NAD(P)H-hydrate dehydratase [Proteobacteria bacterium]|nr:NAD(P)H-hydrate dehydratase [Pseudomonadota bacterium]
MKLPTALEMQKLDRTASEDFGIPSIVLMENAGLGTVTMIDRELGPCANTFALIFVGPGNNGGDGLVIGRHLHQRGCQPVFFLLVNPDALKKDSAVNWAIIKKLRLPFHIVDNRKRVETIPILFQQFETRGLPCYVVIDAIFGIGLDREVADHFADTINLINKPGFANNVPRVSVDTPSGIDSDTGKVLGTCIHADYTATYCCAKPGHFIHGSSEWTGKLTIIDIGIPPEAIDRAGIVTELATFDTCRQISKSLQRQKASHKGSHGHLLVLAGSPGKTGAAILSARGALRTGAGLVTLCAPHNFNLVYESTLTEAMTIPLPGNPDILSIADWEIIVKAVTDKQALVIGPGIGQDPQTAELVMRIYQEVKCPVILDADALNVLAAHQDGLHTPGGPRIFTPHPGELARLLQKKVADIQDNRIDAAMLGSGLFRNDAHETILVLKGAGTIIVSGDGTTFINTTGNPGMATGGMGDVLGGIIGALVCQGLSPMNAAIAGVFLHGSAADMLYDQRGTGFMASEVADMIPSAVTRLSHGNSSASDNYHSIG